MVPTDVVFLDEIPLNASKKHDLVKLEKMYDSGAKENIKKLKRD